MELTATDIEGDFVGVIVPDLVLHRAQRSRLRAMALAAMLLLLAQAAIGMIVNLYVTIAVRHPGAHPSSYFTGSLKSTAWAVAHGPVALAVHAALGVVLVVIVITTAVVARRLGRAKAEAIANPDRIDQAIEPLALDLAADDRQRQHDVLLGA